MILRGLTKKIKAKFIRNIEVDEDEIDVTYGDGTIKTVDNTENAKAKLINKQEKFVQKYNEKYRKNVDKKAKIFGALSSVLLPGALVAATVGAFLVPALIPVGLASLSAGLITTFIYKDCKDDMDTMDVAKYYLENKKELNSFAKFMTENKDNYLDETKKKRRIFSLKKENPYKNMVKAQQSKDGLNIFNLIDNAVTKEELMQAKMICEYAKRKAEETKQTQINVETKMRAEAQAKIGAMIFDAQARAEAIIADAKARAEAINSQKQMKNEEYRDVETIKPEDISVEGTTYQLVKR